MTHLVNQSDQFAADAAEGFRDVHSRLVRPVRSGIVRARRGVESKVALVLGGGSGHYPAFAGYVGEGLADAAVSGQVFASPSTRAVCDVARRAHQGKGVVLGFGNYTGDVLNFGLAAERLRSEGIDVRILATTDDVASSPKGSEMKRRGVAGDLAIFKITGAAAEAGKSLDEVETIGRLANARTRSFGVAFGGCTLPGADQPLFTVPEGRVAVGLGIHGEPGIDEVASMTAEEVAGLLVNRLLEEAPENPGMRVGALLNGLGSTAYEELFVLWSSIAKSLRTAGMTIVTPLVGQYVTSLNMEGCSLTLVWLDPVLEPLWLAPCDCAALHIGEGASSVPQSSEEQDDEFESRVWPPASAESYLSGVAIAEVFDRLADAFSKSEVELGRIDARAGDGDHGQGMARGSHAAAAAARSAANQKAGASSVMAAAADAWADAGGGTSGAIWGLGLRAASSMLSDSMAARKEQASAAATHALDKVMQAGGARVGDKTLVDAFAPFAEVLTASIQNGETFCQAWARAAEAADEAAKATASLLPRLGRARPLAARSLGHPDAGATSFAIAAQTVSAALGEIPCPTDS